MKILKKIYEIENKLCKTLGSRFTYLLIFLAVIGCYFLGYEIVKIIF